MVQYAYLLRPCRSSLPVDATAEEQRIVGAHFDYLKRHRDEGRVIFVGRCEDATFGIAVYDAESDAAAEAFMRDDPAVRAGVMTATVYPFRIALMREYAPVAGG